MFTKKGRPSGKGGTCGSTKSALHKLAVQGMLKFFHPRRPSHSPGKGELGRAWPSFFRLPAPVLPGMRNARAEGGTAKEC